jgi:DNA-binding NtrC family response regulator
MGMTPTVLVVSLDESLLETRHKLLLSAGYNALKASTWAEFEKACGSHQLDLVLLGQTLPPSLKHDMDDFTRKHCPETKIAELYLYAQSIPAKYALNASANEPETLLAFVAKVLAQK